MADREKEQYHIDILVGLAERTIKKLWVIIILLIVLLFGSNAGWLYYESQFETVESTTNEIEQEVDTGEGSAIVSGVGDIYYGEGQADGQISDDQNPNP